MPSETAGAPGRTAGTGKSLTGRRSSERSAGVPPAGARPAGAGRVTSRRRSPVGRSVREAGAARPEKWELDASLSVRNGWVWRGFLLLSLLALGVSLILDGNHHGALALAWVVIAAGWFALSMWLWRRHSRYMRR